MYQSHLRPGAVSGDPYQTTARYRSTCPKCNNQIAHGDDVIIWPKGGRGRKAVHNTEGCGAPEYRGFLELADDEAMMGGCEPEGPPEPFDY